MNCEHEFEYEKDWKKKINFTGEIIEIPVVCQKCGLKANEVWIFSCHVEMPRYKITGEYDEK